MAVPSNGFQDTDQKRSHVFYFLTGQSCKFLQKLDTSPDQHRKNLVNPASSAAQTPGPQKPVNLIFGPKSHLDLNLGPTPGLWAYTLHSC